MPTSLGPVPAKLLSCFSACDQRRAQANQKADKRRRYRTNGTYTATAAIVSPSTLGVVRSGIAPDSAVERTICVPSVRHIERSVVLSVDGSVGRTRVGQPRVGQPRIFPRPGSDELRAHPIRAVWRIQVQACVGKDTLTSTVRCNSQRSLLRIRRGDREFLSNDAARGDVRRNDLLGRRDLGFRPTDHEAGPVPADRRVAHVLAGSKGQWWSVDDRIPDQARPADIGAGRPRDETLS